MLGKEFETHWVRCKKCGAGKPKEAFKGAINRICIDCRKKKKKSKSVIHK